MIPGLCEPFRGLLANSDGVGTVRSSHVTFNRWEVYDGDDGIFLKAKSTNIVIKNSIFHNGFGVASGSIGQYNGQFETIEGSHVENVHFDNTSHAAYVKPWTADQNGYALNGGGGGLECKFALYRGQCRGRKLTSSQIPRTSASETSPPRTSEAQPLQSQSARASAALQAMATAQPLSSMSAPSA